MTSAPGLERPTRSRLVLRSISWRLGSSIAFGIVAVVAVTAAAAAPLYLNAADQSIVSNVLAPLAPSRTGITLTEAPDGRANAGAGLLAAAAGVPGGSGQRRATDSLRRSSPPTCRRRSTAPCQASRTVSTSSPGPGHAPTSGSSRGTAPPRPTR